MSIPVCDRDCFNCQHDDCIQDGVSDEEVKASAALDREARTVKKDNRQRELAERQRRYYEQNKAAIAENQRRYRETHKDELAECQRRYYEQHKDELAEYKRRYYRRKKEGVKSGMQVDTEGR